MAGELINMDGIGNALVYIADKIGVTVAQMYEIYVKAQATMAMLQIVMIVVLFGVSIGTFLIMYYWGSPKMEPTETTVLGKMFNSFVITIIVFIVVAFFCALLYAPLLAYFCPEYTGLQNLMGDIGNIAKVLR